MLAADQRLRRADDFSTVIRGGRRAGRGGLVVHLVSRDATSAGARIDASRGSASPRAGFVVPRAVGPAVARNLVRRRLRHLLRERLSQLPPDTDVVIRVLPSAVDLTFAQLGVDLAAALTAASRSRERKSSRG